MFSLYKQFFTRGFMSLPTIFSTEGFSAYYKAVSNEPKDLKKSIKTLSPHYGDATYEKFEAHHVPQNLGSRLVEAIPAFAYSALVKTTYHIALALLNTVKGNFTLARSNIYAFVRDLDEAGGWLLKIFHDKLGSYVVQRSLFQKSCYSLFEARQNQTPRPSNDNYPVIDEMLIPDQTSALTLKEFKDMDEENRAKVIAGLGSFKSLFSTPLSVETLKKNLEGLKSKGKDFFQRLEGTSDRVLELVTFADLIQSLEVVQYALLSDDEFVSIKLRDIRGESCQSIEFIRNRLEHFKLEELSSAPLKENMGEVTIGELCNASGGVISGHLKTISRAAFELLTKEQLQQLDLSSLTTEKDFQAPFGYRGNTTETGVEGPFEYREKVKERFAYFSGPQVQSMLPFLGRRYLDLISNEQLSQLDLSGLKQEEFYPLFGSYGRKAEERFAYFSGPQVQSLLASLGNYLRFVSKEQLPHLDLSSLTTEKEFEALFGYSGSEEAKERFACLSGPQVQSILPNLGSYLKLISKEQLPQLDLSSLTTKKEFEALFGYARSEDAKERFACLSGPQVQSLLPFLGDYLELVSKEQLPQLDLSSLTREVDFEWLFGYVDSQKSKERFPLLSGKQVQSIFPCLGRYLGLVSEQQLQQFDLSGLTKQEDFQAFFGSEHNWAAKKCFARFSKDQVQSMLPNLGIYLRWVSEQQLRQLDLSGLTERKDFEALFIKNTGEEKKRLSCVQDISPIFCHLNISLLKLVSNTQIASLDTSKWCQEQVSRSFPASSIEEVRKGWVTKNGDQCSFDGSSCSVVSTNGRKQTFQNGDKIIQDIIESIHKENTEKMRL